MSASESVRAAYLAGARAGAAAMRREALDQIEACRVINDYASAGEVAWARAIDKCNLSVAALDPSVVIADIGIGETPC